MGENTVTFIGNTNSQNPVTVLSAGSLNFQLTENANTYTLDKDGALTVNQWDTGNALFGTAKKSIVNKGSINVTKEFSVGENSTLTNEGTLALDNENAHILVHEAEHGKLTVENSDGGVHDDGVTTYSWKHPIVPAPQKKKVSLNDGLRLSEKNGVVTIRFGEYTGADSYWVYLSYCGARSTKPVKVLKGYKTTQVNISKLGGKKIDQKRSLNAWVVARKGGKNVRISSKLHIAGPKSKKETNARSITVKTQKLTLRKGKSANVGAKIVKVNGKKALLNKVHGPALTYTTTNKKVVTVNQKGQMTAKGKGTARVKVRALNGVAKVVTVTVK